MPLPFQEFIESQLTQNQFRILPIEPRHAAMLTVMPLHHRDPFDRMLIAQSLSERIPIASADAEFDRYGLNRMW